MGVITVYKPTYNWLVLSTYTSEKWWTSSVGMMKFPISGKIKNAPKQPNQFLYVYDCWCDLAEEQIIAHLWLIQPDLLLAESAWSFLPLKSVTARQLNGCRSGHVRSKWIHLCQHVWVGVLGFIPEMMRSTCRRPNDRWQLKMWTSLLW